MVNSQRHVNIETAFGLETPPPPPHCETMVRYSLVMCIVCCASHLFGPSFFFSIQITTNGHLNGLCTDLLATIDDVSGIDPLQMCLDMPSTTATTLPCLSDGIQLALPTYANGHCHISSTASVNTDDGSYTTPDTCGIHELISDSTFNDFLCAPAPNPIDHHHLSNNGLIDTSLALSPSPVAIATHPIAVAQTASPAPATSKTKSTSKVSKTKTTKRPAINYSHQKLILPNKKHIPLESLLSPGEPRVNKKVKPTTTAKKKIPNTTATTTKVMKNNLNIVEPTNEYVTTLANGITSACTQTTTTVSVPQLPAPASGVYLVASDSKATDTSSSSPVKQLITNNSCSMPNETVPQNKITMPVAVNTLHFVAMNYNFAEYMPQLSTAVVTTAKSEQNITLKT